MAAPESTKFQVNFRSSDGTLINLYAANKEELESLLSAAQDFSALIGAVSQSFGSAPAPAPVQSGQKQMTPTPQATGGHVCTHGTMTLKEGVSAKGPWKGYFCPSPKGTPDQCKTIFVR